MKNSGINRRIDELGRIVIPRDIRDSLRIKPGDNFDIRIEGEQIVMRKDSPINDKLQHLYAMCEVLSEQLAVKVMFYYDGVFIDPGRTTSIKDLPIKVTASFEQVLAQFHPTSFNDQQIFVDVANTEAGYAYPIISKAKILGVFVIFKTLSQLTESDLAAMKLCEEIILKQVQI